MLVQKTTTDVVLMRRTFAISLADNGQEVMADHDVERRFFNALERIPDVIEADGGMSAMTLAYWVDVGEVSDRRAEQIKRRFISTYNRFVGKGR